MISLKKNVLNATHHLIANTPLPTEQQAALLSQITLETLILIRPSHPKFGDYTTNIALILAKPLKQNPRDLANNIIAHLEPDAMIEKTDIAGPGHLNFFTSQTHKTQCLIDILTQKAQYGRKEKDSDSQNILIEFVSANPTGPLHVGHGRGAAYGASLASILKAAGHRVTCEYYVNDAGRQMNILATSVWLRYLEFSMAITLPSNAYQGNYIIDIAQSDALNFLEATRDVSTLEAQEQSLLTSPPDATARSEDKEAHLNQVITLCQNLLGADHFQRLKNIALEEILSDIKSDLSELNVTFDHWFAESSLTKAILQSIQQLQSTDHIYKQDSALWFRSTAFGDDKDRVVQRDNGQTTYFAADIAYHAHKYQQNYDQYINIWGADHHGYIARVKAAIEALNLNPDQLQINLVQFANLIENNQRVAMSTRSGQFVTLRSLREKVGTDATRYFYIQNKPDQHMDFDISLAQSQNKDNPVYYIQYAHARANSIKAQVPDLTNLSSLDLSSLTLDSESQLLNKLADYPSCITQAARQHQPHQVATYLLELASDFHSYYNATRILIEDQRLQQARVYLVLSIQQVIHNGLSLLGISAPERM